MVWYSIYVPYMGTISWYLHAYGQLFLSKVLFHLLKCVHTCSEIYTSLNSYVEPAQHWFPLYPFIKNAGHAESILDDGSQIVSMFSICYGNTGWRLVETGTGDQIWDLGPADSTSYSILVVMTQSEISDKNKVGTNN
jgi:hypothetical protein